MNKPRDPLEITPTLLLRAYSAGVFPMAESGSSGEIFWVDPKTRGILPLDGLHISRSMRKFVRKTPYKIRINHDFRGTMQDCADREETWINREICELYHTLNKLGYAHSVEVWDGSNRIGGLYGVDLGGAFFGESMFSAAPNTSKLALIHLVARLRAGGYQLLDTQFVTDHLLSLGAVEISKPAYQVRLALAMETKGDFFALSPQAGPDQILHLSTQTS